MTTPTTESNKNSNTEKIPSMVGRTMAVVALTLVGYGAGHELSNHIVDHVPVETPTYTSHDSEGDTYFDEQWNQIPTEEQPISDTGRMVVEGSLAAVGAGTGVAVAGALERKRANDKARQAREAERRKRAQLRRSRNDR